jgi:LPS export ABC transporter protein LptC
MTPKLKTTGVALVTAACCLTAYLTACRQRSQPDVVALRTAADSADQTLFGVLTNLTTTTGVKRGALVSDTAYVLRDATLFAFRVVRVTFVSDSGVPIATLTADRATLRPSQGVLNLTGNLTLTSTGGRMAHAASGQYSSATNRITMDSSVSVGSPAQHSVKALTTDPTFEHLTCTPGC